MDPGLILQLSRHVNQRCPLEVPVEELVRRLSIAVFIERLSIRVPLTSEMKSAR